MKKSIFTVAEILKGIALIKGNRAINAKNLKRKIASIQANGQLMPIMVAEAIDAIEEGLILVDAQTGQEITQKEIENYLVIIEGQHRYAAIMYLKDQDAKNGTKFAPDDIYMMYAINPKKVSLKKQIAECNIVSVLWDGGDFVTGAYLCMPTNEVLQYAKELTDTSVSPSGKGYPLSTISKIITRTSNLTKDKLAEAMDKGEEIIPSGDIAKAREFVQTARAVGFGDNYIAKRYLIDWFIDECNNASVGEERAIERLKSLTYRDIETIKKLKADEAITGIKVIADKKTPL